MEQKRIELRRNNVKSNGANTNPDIPRLLMDFVRQRSQMCRMAHVSYSIDLYNNSCLKLQGTMVVGTANEQLYDKENEQLGWTEVTN
jgi:hypothetical protein